ncbi:DUF5777 family beta-barrel protein [Hymenobacter sp. 15J16-1T3B]|uniref:DUF5777 family beta-barrel protein n=1 Tax=Hymenobacter sp. 15J16-1T3B TaxID=2886941 RepID=UPI001D114818|nr:DUF5777 family beta-barrel protein [Hymenobacter sp. 15J16-1T3B]MCC3157593.1 DUF5777 family beta-barrel protein [Hymenobacter sp. 15J16-1T3B]
MLPLYPTPLRRLLLSGALLLGLHLTAAAQDDLLQQLEQQTTTQAKPDFATATFKGTRIVNGQSVETPASGSLQFLIGHRFGQLNSGAYNFFGLDQATIRLGLEYGLNDRLAVGVGRSSMDKTFDGFVKYKALRQHSGPRAMPVTLTLLATSTITTLKFPVGADRSTSSRMAYSYQGLVARKFSPGLSAQLMPTLVHRNLVAQPSDDNDVYAVGGAVRQKLSKRIALTAEYYYVLSGTTADQTHNPLAIGFDIETGGHVFQLHFTNAQGMVDPLFIPRTTGNFFKGDIFFGFNISRSFGLNHKKE